MSWTNAILDELSWTDTHLDELSELVRSSELVRPPEKIQSVNFISDEPSQYLQGFKSCPWAKLIRKAKENMMDEWACFGLHLGRNMDPNISMVYNFGLRSKQDIPWSIFDQAVKRESQDKPKPRGRPDPVFVFSQHIYVVKSFFWSSMSCF